MKQTRFSEIIGNLEMLRRDIAKKEAEFQSAECWREQLPVVAIPGISSGTRGDRKYLKALYAKCLAEAQFRQAQKEVDLLLLTDLFLED